MLNDLFQVSPTLLNRMIGSVKEVFGGLLSDIYITVDHRKGQNATRSVPSF